MAAPPPKGKLDATPQASYSSIPELLGEWIRQGTEGFIATQKILLDLAAQQNALALTIVRERLGSFSLSPSKAAFDLFGKGIHNFMEAQRVVLDAILRQNEIVTGTFEPALAGTPVKKITGIVHDGLNNFVEAQKQFLDFFENQAEDTVKDYRDGKGFDTARLAKLAREGTHDFLTSQRKFIQIVEEHLTSKVEEPASKEAEAQRVCLLDMAKQSVDALVEAEKRLLDLASNQVDVNVKFAREIYTSEKPAHPPTKLPDLMKKSMDSFVAAQKALVELASKPRHHEAEEHEPELVGAKG